MKFYITKWYREKRGIVEGTRAGSCDDSYLVLMDGDIQVWVEKKYCYTTRQAAVRGMLEELCQYIEKSIKENLGDLSETKEAYWTAHLAAPVELWEELIRQARR